MNPIDRRISSARSSIEAADAFLQGAQRVPEGESVTVYVLRAVAMLKDAISDLETAPPGGHR